MSTIEERYLELVETMRDLGAALIPAVAVRYEAPPRTRAIKDSVSESKGVSNPTLDTVLDPRRVAVSDAVAETASALRRAAALLDPHRSNLRSVVAGWEGQEGLPE